MRVLTGIQPSGKLHIGNYFGAIKQILELQNSRDNELFALLLTITHLVVVLI